MILLIFFTKKANSAKISQNSINVVPICVAQATKPVKPAGNLVEELAANGASTLFDFAVRAGLTDTLTTRDTELLKSVLLYHVVPGNILSSQASNDLTLDAAQGNSLRVIV